MPASESILNKIKLLVKLSESPNPNEAQNAKDMVDKLINKYSITQEELQSVVDKKSAYCENDLVFNTQNICGWKSQLALCLAFKFDCQIVQEQVIPTEGQSSYDYYVFGDDSDAFNVKHYFNVLNNKILDLINENCVSKGPIYIDSYCEGVVQSIRNSIELGDIQLIKLKSDVPVESEKIIGNGNANLAPIKQEKEKLETEVKTDVGSQSIIKDIGAYFNGLSDGLDVYLIKELK